MTMGTPGFPHPVFCIILITVCVFFFLNNQKFVIERDMGEEKKDWEAHACPKDFTNQAEKSRNMKNVIELLILKSRW